MILGAPAAVYRGAGVLFGAEEKKEGGRRRRKEGRKEGGTKIEI